MHEETRRKLYGIAFVLLCIVPTVCMLGLGGYVRTPAPQRAIEQQIEATLGVIAEVDRLHPLRPGQFQLGRIKLFDSESHDLLLELNNVTATQPARRARRTPHPWSVQIDAGQVSLPQLRTLWKVYRERILKNPTMGRTVEKLLMRKLTVNSDRGPTILHSLNWNLENEGEWHHSQASFGVDGATGEPIGVSIQRDRETSPATTSIVLDTKQHPLPNSLLTAMATGIDTRKWFDVRGRLVTNWVDDIWSCQFDGSLINLNLQALAPSFLPTDAAGNAMISTSARFSQQGLESGRAKLRVRSTMLPTLCDELVSRGVFARGEGYDGLKAQAEAQREVALFVWLDAEHGLQIQGVDKAHPRVVVANDQGQPAVLSVRPIPIERLYAVFMRPAEAALETARILQALLPKPLPQL